MTFSVIYASSSSNLQNIDNVAHNYVDMSIMPVRMW